MFNKKNNEMNQYICLSIVSSVSQPFLPCGTLSIKKNLAAHLYQKFLKQDLEK
jgi:hypothetical protein